MASSKSKSFVAPVGASESVLADGRVLVPGEPVDLDADAQADEHNARLIEEGNLLEVEGKSAVTQSSQSENGGEK